MSHGVDVFRGCASSPPTWRRGAGFLAGGYGLLGPEDQGGRGPCCDPTGNDGGQVREEQGGQRDDGALGDWHRGVRDGVDRMREESPEPPAHEGVCFLVPHLQPTQLATMPSLSK